MKDIHNPLQKQSTKFKLIQMLATIVFFLLLPLNLISQIKDTIYIQFDEKYEEMRKDDFTREIQTGSPDEVLNKSITYYIKQMEPACGYADEFQFTHVNHPKKAYEQFGGEPPVILCKEESFLKDKKVVDINFFRTTPYLEIAKTFEDEDSWEQDVIIFVVDEGEKKKERIILREVTFRRPVKE